MTQAQRYVAWFLACVYVCVHVCVHVCVKRLSIFYQNKEAQHLTRTDYVNDVLAALEPLGFEVCVDVCMCLNVRIMQSGLNWSHLSNIQREPPPVFCSPHHCPDGQYIYSIWWKVQILTLIAANKIN